MNGGSDDRSIKQEKSYETPGKESLEQPLFVVVVVVKLEEQLGEAFCFKIREHGNSTAERCDRTIPRCVRSHSAISRRGAIADVCGGFKSGLLHSTSPHAVPCQRSPTLSACGVSNGSYGGKRTAEIGVFLRVMMVVRPISSNEMGLVGAGARQSVAIKRPSWTPSRRNAACKYARLSVGPTYTFSGSHW